MAEVKITNKLLKEAIADAETLVATAVENAKLSLEETFTPQIKSMLDRRLRLEAEGGEAIINKKSTAMFSPILSAINSYGGNGDKFERGGLLGTPSTTKIGDTTNAQLLGALNNVNFNPTVSVVEINEAQTRISELNTSSQL